MTYIPLNRIKTNLYTNGFEYQIESTGVPYIGFYWKNYKGEVWSGKNPNEKPTTRLFPVEDKKNKGEDDLPFTQNAELYNLVWEEYEGPYSIIEDSLETYNQLLNVDVNKILNTPYQFYPKPTKDDYNLGAFTRYFCVKVNENIYFEISKDTYDALDNKSEDWMWELYTPFQLIWTISGEEKEIEKTNYNMTIIREKRLKRRGLTQFLRNNYLKFYPSPFTTEDVIPPTTNIPTKEDKPSIKDLFKTINPTNRLMITPEEIENAKIATPTVTSSIGNPLTGIEAVFDPNQNKKKGS